jgi:quinol monooxygenase YgiN
MLGMAAGSRYHPACDASFHVLHSGPGMIRHIVLFRARDPRDREAVRDGLALLKDIPAADVLEVEYNSRIDPWSDEADIVVYGEFADEAALAAFKAHPLYAESIRRVRPLRDLRIAADYAAPV